ncbi:MAG: ZIP family metal transporter [Candidatus Bathyarchaeota archaeon]|nr:ZIP family metal transporter [Candidatus Bathyarchaeota archaeon]
MDIVTPILLSLLAGSSTGIGGLIVLLFGKIEERVIGFLMGFAGGVMLIVSFLQLYSQALTNITPIKAVFAFAIGTFFMMLIDLTLPHIEFGEWERDVKDRRLFNSGIVIAIGMSLHNLPEGIVVSAGYSHLPRLGILVAIMICFHNIPEGIATVMPLIQSGVNKWRAVGLATVSGLMEPVGAIIGVGFFMAFGGSTSIVGWALGFASGVMTYITIDELIPIAHEYCTLDNKHMVSTGLLTGMIFAQLLSIII